LLVADEAQGDEIRLLHHVRAQHLHYLRLYPHQLEGGFQALDDNIDLIATGAPPALWSM
jgi:hypothetical protein